MRSVPAIKTSDTTMQFPSSSYGSSQSKLSSLAHKPCKPRAIDAKCSFSGAWMVLPSYMVFVFARDILQGLAIASGDVSSGPVRPVASIKAE